MLALTKDINFLSIRLGSDFGTAQQAFVKYEMNLMWMEMFAFKIH